MSWISDIFRKKNKHGPVPDDVREIGNLTRKLNAQLKQDQYEVDKERLRLERLQLQARCLEIEESMRGDDDDEEDLASSMFQDIITRIMRPQGENTSAGLPPPPSTTPSTTTRGIDFSDEQINTLLDSVPRSVLPLARRMTDEQLISFAKSKAPEASDESILRAVELFKARK